MSRSSKAELERRIDEVYELILSRVNYRAIVRYAYTKWGVSERSVRTYMARARLRLAALAAESREAQLANGLRCSCAAPASEAAPTPGISRP